VSRGKGSAPARRGRHWAAAGGLNSTGPKSGTPGYGPSQTARCSQPSKTVVHASKARRSVDKVDGQVGGPTSNAASPRGGLVTNRSGCSQLESLEVWAHLDSEAGDQKADPAQEFRLCLQQFRYRDRTARQGLTDPRQKNRQESARAGAVGGTYGPAAVSMPAGTSIGPANNTQLVTPKATTGQPRAHKTRAGAGGGHTQLFK